MIAIRDAGPTCARCGAMLPDGRAFCRLYVGESHLPFCGPVCAEEYLLVSHCNGRSRPGGSVVEEMVAEWRWRELGQ
jgi:hypothetical protein